MRYDLWVGSGNNEGDSKKRRPKLSNCYLKSHFSEEKVS